jgi:hypothetical protein
LLIIGRAGELPEAGSVWGTGGWIEPEEREALDWLTLARFCGWGAEVARLPLTESDLRRGRRWVVVAADPELFGEPATAQLRSRLEHEALLLVARAAAAGSPFAHLAGAARGGGATRGDVVRWSGPGRSTTWRFRGDFEAVQLETEADTASWAALGDVPLVVARPVGRGVVATIAFHPSRARDADGAATALLKHLLVWGAPAPVAWLDFAGTLVLRMDDPGGAQNVHWARWSYPKLGEEDWAAISAHLQKRDARLSIGYVSGWVDDGDPRRGVLTVDGKRARRVAGHVHPSPLVRYEDRGGHRPGTAHDYVAEYRGIEALRAGGLGDVELHGYTHVYPDGAAWAAAADRYEATSWYRELGQTAQPALAARSREHHPLVLGIGALRRYFDVDPTTLICPGDEWTDDALVYALELGLQLVSSYYLAVRHGGRFAWTMHVCGPYLDDAKPGWFDAGLPVVGCFHDSDLADGGVDWMDHWLERWCEAGAERLIDLRELAAAVGCQLSIEDGSAGPRLTVRADKAPALVRPLAVAVRLSDAPVPSPLTVALDGREVTVPVDRAVDGVGRLTLPAEPAGVAPAAVSRRREGRLRPPPGRRPSSRSSP